MRWTFPNLLSLCRLGLVPLFAIALLQERPQRALVVFAIAALTDALDGLMARWLGQESVIGAYLDPMADKLLLTTAFVAALQSPCSCASNSVPTTSTAFPSTSAAVVHELTSAIP